jgi:ribonuclease-3
MDAAKISELEIRLGHEFSDKKELYRALTHSTFSNVERSKLVGARDCPHQTTYATLGDAILKAGFILLLMEKGWNTKGAITISKADLENNLKLADVGERLRILEDHFFFHRIGGEENVNEGAETYRSDTVEALIGAIFIDSGYSIQKTKDSITTIFGPELERLESDLKKIVLTGITNII